MKSESKRWAFTLALAVAFLGAVAVVSATDGEEAAPQQRIKMYAENWKWTPDTVRVKVGTTVRIDFVSRDASHSFVMKEFDIKVPLPQDREAHVEFVADRVGEFRWKCGRPCGDGCAKMTGKLVVEE